MKLRTKHWFIVFLLVVFVPLRADIVIDFVQKGTAGYECYQVIGGVETTISNHTQERKALARCAEEKVKNLVGDYRVRANGYIKVVISADVQAQLVRGVQIDSNFPIPSAPESDWIATEIGAGVCTSLVDNAGELTIVAAGETKDNSCFIHKSITSGDIQLTARVVSTAGADIDGSFVALAIRGGTGANNPDSQLRWLMPGRNNGNYRIEQDGVTRGGIVGNSDYVLPIYSGIARRDSEDEITVWETDSVNADPTADYNQIPDAVPWTLSPTGLTASYEVGFVVSSNHVSNTITVVLDDIDLSGTITLVDSDPGGAPDRSLRWEFDLETGAVQQKTSAGQDSGGLAHVGPDPANDLTITGVTKANPGVVTYSGSRDPADTPGGPEGFTVSGVNGMTELNGLFIRACNINSGANTFEICVDNFPLYTGNDHVLAGYNLNTTGFTTYTDSGTLEAYQSINISNGGLENGSGELVTVEDSTNSVGADNNISPRGGNFFLHTDIRYTIPYDLWNDGHSLKSKPRWGLTPPDEARFDWDLECWMGFSIYMPSDLEHDTAGSDHRWGNMLMTLQGYSTSADHFQLTYRVPSGQSVSHWILRESFSPRSIMQSELIEHDFGAVALGEWTDYVIRFRGNPFDTETNASEVTSRGQDRIFLANTGIFQVWMGTSEPLTLVFDKENEPVGNVPDTDFLLRMTYRNYKYGWKSNDTDVIGPIEMGFDEVRYGCAVADGTGYSDVAPSGANQP